MILILVLLTRYRVGHKTISISKLYFSSAGGQRCWPCSNQADCSVETFNPTASIPCSTQCFSTLDSNSLIVDAGCVTTEDCNDSDILCCPANNGLPSICRIQQFGSVNDRAIHNFSDNVRRPFKSPLQWQSVLLPSHFFQVTCHISLFFTISEPNKISCM